MAPRNDNLHDFWVDRLSKALVAGTYCTPSGQPAIDPFARSAVAPQQTVPAGAIRDALLKGLKVSASGLQLGHVVIVGDIDLTNVDFPYPFWLNKCRLDGNLNLTNSKFAQFALTEVCAKDIVMNGADIAGGVHCFRKLTATSFSATDAKIGHRFYLSEAQLSGDDNTGIALALDATEVRGSVVFENIRAQGEVRMPAAQLSNQLSISGGTVENIPGNALRLDGARIDGGIHVESGVVIRGRISALGATIGVAFQLNGAQLSSIDSETIMADNAHISGDLLCDGLSCKGAIRCVGLQVDGSIFLDGAELYSKTGTALELSNAKIAGHLALRDGFRSVGSIRAAGARIGGRITFQNSRLFCRGEVIDVRNSTIEGDLEIGPGAIFTGAINAASTSVFGSVVFEKAYSIAGEETGVVFDAAKITGNLTLHKSVLIGGLSCTGAEIGGELNVRSAQLTKSDVALDLRSASIRRAIVSHVTIDPGIDFSRASINDLEIIGDIPNLLTTSGLSVTDVHGCLRNDWRVADTWLRSMPGEIQPAQPWHALAAIYERNGDPAGARRLKYRAAQMVTRQSRGWSKLVLWLYGSVVGHGYYPLRAAAWLIISVVLGCAIVGSASGNIVPTRPAEATAAATAHAAKSNGPSRLEAITGATPCASHPGYPCLNPVYFGISSLSPTTVTTSADWVIRSDATPWFVLSIWILKISAWVFAAMLLAGFTGLLRKT